MPPKLQIAAYATLLIGVLTAELSWAQPAAGVATPDPRALLDQMYTAMGGSAWQAPAGLEMSGRYDQGGLRGTFRQLVDLRQGRDVFSFDMGSTRAAQGTSFDHSWWSDEKGLPTIEEGPESRADAATGSFEDRNGWFHPGAAVPVFYAGSTVEDGRVFERVRLLPPEGRELTLWIDARTHWLDRVAQLDAEQRPFTVYFYDYRQIDGVWLSFRQRESTGDAVNDATAIVTHLRLIAAPLSDADFAAPSVEIRDARLLGNVSSTSVPFALKDGMAVVEVSINGRAPLPFALDSGGLNLLTPAAAAELGVKPEGDVPVDGVGERLMSSRLAHVRRYQLGLAQLDDQQFIVMPLPPMLTSRGNRQAVAGLIGYELLRRFQVTIDYQQQRLTLAPPSSQAAGERLPLYFQGRRPFIEAAVDGVDGYFGLDTGDDGGLTLFDRFYAAHDFPIQLPGLRSQQAGVGGSSSTLLTRVDTLALGDWTLARPLTDLNFAKIGAFAAGRIAGNLGSLVWQNFVLTFDYAHRALYMRKSADFGVSMPYDRSGLHPQMNRAGQIIVRSVDPGSPAELAGLQPGDELLTVQQRPLGADYAALRAQLTRPAGTAVQLSVRRGWLERLKTTMILEELLPIDQPLRRASQYLAPQSAPHDAPATAAHPGIG